MHANLNLVLGLLEKTRERERGKFLTKYEGIIATIIFKQIFSRIVDKIFAAQYSFIYHTNHKTVNKVIAKTTLTSFHMNWKL